MIIRLKQQLLDIKHQHLQTTLVQHFTQQPVTHLTIAGLESDPRWTTQQRKHIEHQRITQVTYTHTHRPEGKILNHNTHSPQPAYTLHLLHIYYTHSIRPSYTLHTFIIYHPLHFYHLLSISHSPYTYNTFIIQPLHIHYS